MKTKRKAFALRIDERILSSVQRWADDELRSVNAQIEYLLRDALRNAGRLKVSADNDKKDGDDAAP